MRGFDNKNPDMAPVAVLAVPPTPPWRLVPATFCGFVGVLILSAIVLVVVGLYKEQRENGLVVPGDLLMTIILAIVMTATTGAIFIAAARCWLRSRLWLAAAVTTAAIIFPWLLVDYFFFVPGPTP